MAAFVANNPCAGSERGGSELASGRHSLAHGGAQNTNRAADHRCSPRWVMEKTHRQRKREPRWNTFGPKHLPAGRSAAVAVSQAPDWEGRGK